MLERYVHLYYSIGKARKERADLEQKIDRIGKHLKKQEGKKVTIDKSFEKYFKLYIFIRGKRTSACLYQEAWGILTLNAIIGALF